MHRFDRPRQALAIGLAALAGQVDAIGFLSAEGYFVSFMSGNTTRLAVDLAVGWQVDWHRALTPALLIAGFVAGVTAGAWLARKSGAWRKPAIVGMVSALLLIAAALRAAGDGNASLAALVLAMGALNNTFQREGEVAVGLTYMTGALVRFGQGLGAVLAGEKREGWLANGLLWLGLALGALAGALSFQQLGHAALWIAAGFGGSMALAAWRIAGRDAAQST